MPDYERSAFAHGTTPVPESFISLLANEFQLTKDDEVLEIGCGEGYLTRALTPYVARVDAIDESSSMLAVARTLGESAKVRYLECRARDFVPRTQYKLIISLEAFHLVREKATVLRWAADALVPGGAMCVAWVEFFWEQRLFATYADAYSQFGIPWGTAPNFAALDLERLGRDAIPGPGVEYGSFAVQIPEAFSLQQIAGYLSSISKADGLAPNDRQRLKDLMLRRFESDGVEDPTEGQSFYTARFFRKGTVV
jgi:SAM-dependent methyltransferase